MKNTFSTLAISLLLLNVLAAQEGGKRSGSSRPEPTVPVRSPTPTGQKPEIVQPLSPRSEEIGRQFRDTLSAYQPSAPAALAELKVDVRAVDLPARKPGETEPSDQGKLEERTDYDWQSLRAIDGRYWLVGLHTLLVSDPGSANRWPVVKKFTGTGRDLADVFALRGATYLLGRNWLAEMSADGDQMLRVVHLAPEGLVAVNMMSYFVQGGPGKKRNLPAEFTSVEVWRDQAYIANVSGWSWTFGKFLNDTGRLDAVVGAGNDEAFYQYYRTPDLKSRVRWTTDGRAWASRAVDIMPSVGELAAGPGRLVTAAGSMFRLSADARESVYVDHRLPKVDFTLKTAGGKMEARSESGRWVAITHADGVFAAVGLTFRAGAEYSGISAPDMPVLGLSVDGRHWRTFPLPGPAPKSREWLIAGAKGKFVMTPKKFSKQVLEVTVSGWPAPAEAHPALRTAAELRRAVEQAAGSGDLRGCITRLAELEYYYPSVNNKRIEALLRAQAGDLDSAWDLLSMLEQDEPNDWSDATLRTQILQQAGRIAESQAYATWFLVQHPAGRGTLSAAEAVGRLKLLVFSGQGAEALHYGEQAATKDTTNAELRVLLGELQLRAGNPAQAKRWLTEAAALGDERAKKMLLLPNLR